MTFKKEYQKTKSSKEETYEQWLVRALSQARGEHKAALDKALSLQESETMLRTQVRQLTNQRDYHKGELERTKQRLKISIRKGEALEKQNEELQTKLETIVGECNYAKEELNASLAREYELKNGSQAPEDRLKKSLTGLVEAMKALEDFCNKHKAQFPKGGLMQEPKLRTKVDEQGKPYHNLTELFDRIASEVHKKPKPLITIKGDINYWRKPGEQTPYKAAVRRDSPTYNDLKQLMKEVDKYIIPYTEIAKRLGLPIGKPLGITINKSKIVVRVLKQKQRDV